MSVFDPDDLAAVKKWTLLFIGPIIALVASLFTDIEGDFTRVGQGYLDPLFLAFEFGLIGVIMGLWKWHDWQGYSNGTATNRGFVSITSLTAEQATPKAETTIENVKISSPKMRVHVEGVSQFAVAKRPKTFLCYPDGHNHPFYGNNVCMTVLEPYPGPKHGEIADYALSTLESVDGFVAEENRVLYGEQLDTEHFASRSTDGEWQVGPGVKTPTISSDSRSLNRGVYAKRKRIQWLMDTIAGRKTAGDEPNE